MGQKAIEAILSLERRRDLVRGRLNQLMEPSAIPDFGHDEWNAEINSLMDNVRVMTATILERRRHLAIEDQARLRSTRHKDFLSDRLSAFALKERIRSALVSRRNELQRLREGVVSTSSGKQIVSGPLSHSSHLHITSLEKKLREHVEQQLKKRQPAISRLVHKYNDLCKRLTAAIEQGSAPPNAIAPTPLNTKQLFSLDVDSELWNDAGLGQEDDDEQVPAWMRDEQVRVGIRFYLDYCRCQEEHTRLQHEMRNLTCWYRSEWGAIKMALASDGKSSLACNNALDDFAPEHTPSFKYILQARRAELLRLLTSWWKDFDGLPLLPKDFCFPDSWGPGMVDVELTLQHVGLAREGTCTHLFCSMLWLTSTPAEGTLESESEDEQSEDENECNAEILDLVDAIDNSGLLDRGGK